MTSPTLTPQRRPAPPTGGRPAPNGIAASAGPSHVAAVAAETRDTRWERWGAASGFAVIALSAAAASFERGSPAATAPPAAVVAYFAAHRDGLLAQSLLFVLSAGVNLWFLGSLRSFLLRAEGSTGRLSAVAFGAGAVGVAINAIMQAPQIALAMASRGQVEPALAGMLSALMYALTTISFVPVAVMLAAVAVVSFRAGAFPAWLGWLSAVTAITDLVGSFGMVAASGPLTPGGWLTYVVFALLAVWLLSVTSVMVVRLGRPAHAPDSPDLVEGITPATVGAGRKERWS